MDYDSYLVAEYERQEEKAAREEGLMEEFEKVMDSGSRDYLEYTTVEEMADLFDAIRSTLGAVNDPLSLRLAHAQSLIADFQNSVSYRFAVRETTNWHTRAYLKGDELEND